METTRFETFFDAIIAIIITVLVLKIPQPTTPTIGAILQLNTVFIAYLISFLTLYNLWYANHNLFQVIDTIDNSVVWRYGVMTFIISLLPYFTLWLAYDIHSVPAETMFGLIFILTHIFNRLAMQAIYKSNPYNKQLIELDFNSNIQSIPLCVLIIGFILTYIVYTPGIYICCLIAVLLWVFFDRIIRRGNNGN